VHNKQLNDYLFHICSCYHPYTYIFHASRYKEARNGDTVIDGVVVMIVDSVCACVVAIVMDCGRGSRRVCVVVYCELRSRLRLALSE
jgi:hypothetical protein